MKSIWNFAMVLFLVAKVGLAAESSVATPPDPNVNPLNVARALVLKTPEYFRGFLQAEMLISNAFQSVEMRFDMTREFVITSLTVNGEEIALPEPINGIPLGDGGLMRNVYIQVNGQTVSGEFAGYGYLQKLVVTKDDSLQVVFLPADIKQEIPGVDVARYGGDLELVIEGIPSGYGYGYGTENGHYYAWVPPIGGRYHYILRQRSTGAVIGSGWLEPFQPTVTPSDAYLSVTYVGNVREVRFLDQVGMDSWAGVDSISFDCLVPTDDGTTVNGKVLFVDVGSGGLEIAMGGQFDIYVQSATSDLGYMPFLPLEDRSTSGDGWYQARVNTISRNVGKVVVTIVPRPENTRENPWVTFHRFCDEIGY